MFEINTIYCMDCLDGMREMEDKSVDLVLTDPPYGIGESSKAHASRCDSGLLKGNNKSLRKAIKKADCYGKKTWDNERIGKEYFEMADARIASSKKQTRLREVFDCSQ